MKRYSLQRRMVLVVVAIELLSLLIFVLLALNHESETRFRAFEQHLESNTATIFGAVEDSDDATDNIMLVAKGLHFSPRDLYDVQDDRGHILGHSDRWPEEDLNRQLPRTRPDGLYTLFMHHREYRFQMLHAVRLIDPGIPSGGTPRAVTIRFGSPVAEVRHEIYEAVFFYTIVSLVLLAATVVGLTWFLSRGFAPLIALAAEAERITSQRWSFHPPVEATCIAELAPLTQALEATVARLQRSFEQQQRLTSDAAHELKTAVAIAKSSLQLLSMRDRTSTEYRSGIEGSLDDILRLEELVVRMLTLARLEAEASHGSASLAQTADAAPLLREAVSRLKAFATLRGVGLSVQAPASAYAPLSADNITLLAENLILNALQHSQAGGSVRAELAAEQDHIALLVADDGDGIPEEALPHIFEPFFRGEASRDRKSGGTGLGLSICKGIVETGGGFIIVRSTMSVGTEVHVRLPARKEPLSSFSPDQVAPESLS